MEQETESVTTWTLRRTGYAIVGGIVFYIPLFLVIKEFANAYFPRYPKLCGVFFPTGYFGPPSIPIILGLGMVPALVGGAACGAVLSIPLIAQGATAMAPVRHSHRDHHRERILARMFDPLEVQRMGKPVRPAHAGT